jgi:hypothetical protein
MRNTTTYGRCELWKPGALRRAQRESGIALMVVFVIFTILILVVFQLQYTTKLEEELAEVRSTESQGSFAKVSLVGKVMALLAEDYASESDGGATNAGGVPGMTGVTGAHGANAANGATLPDGTRLPGGLPPDLASLAGGGGATPTSEADVKALLERELQKAGVQGGSTGNARDKPPTTKDYIHENVFQPIKEEINDLQVKVILVDNERGFDLNRLWDYPRVPAETLSEDQELREREAAEEAAAEGEDPEDERGLSAEDIEEIGGSLGELEDLDLNTPTEIRIPPTEESRELVREMLGRAMDLMIRLNEENGFYYEFGYPDPEYLALAIEEYCFERVFLMYPSTISLVSEMLMIPDGSVTPEIYYGPQPLIAPGDEFFDANGEFLYERDEFGDLTTEYLYTSDDWLYEQEERESRLDELQGEFGPNQSFAFLGGLMGNSLTQNMKPIPELEDGSGLAVAPKPIGLRDIFCTMSSGRVNINTAPAPVVYGLLLSLDEDEAYHVASRLQAYRDELQEEIIQEDLEDGETVTEQTEDEEGCPQLGQPRHTVTEEELLLEEEGGYGSLFEGSSGGGGSGLGGLGALAGMGGMGGMDSGMLGGGFENYPTNYLTSIQQIELVDGCDESSEDRLTSQGQGVERVSAEHASMLQRVQQNLLVGDNVSFGSNFFTATIKTMTKDSPTVSSGRLVVYRDTHEKQITVLQWNESD